MSLRRFASLTLVAVIVSVGACGVCRSKTVGRAPVVVSQATVPAPSLPSNAGQSSSQPLTIDIPSLTRRIESFERTVDQMQKADSRINSIAPWIAITISCVGLFPLLLIWYEWSIRRSSEKKFDDFKVEARNEIDRSMKAAQIEVSKGTDDKLRDQLSYLITSELRRVTQKIENDYGRDLARVDCICYSVIQNEFLAKCDGNGVIRGVEYLHIFRHLLLLLVAGDGRARQAALHRLRNEFVGDCGPTTRSQLGALLAGFERDARFSRQELAAPLSDLKNCCVIQ
jgi:hypothetical protein